jgi:hypothetical protein
MTCGVPGSTTYFVYSSEDGKLLGEYNSAGQPIRICVHLEGEQVAMLENGIRVTFPSKKSL